MHDNDHAESPQQRDTGKSGLDRALDNAHPDTVKLIQQRLSLMAEGATFTTGQLWSGMPGYIDDHPARRGAVTVNLARAGYIEHAGYAARAAEDGWDRPARLWRRTSTPITLGGAK